MIPIDDPKQPEKTAENVSQATANVSPATVDGTLAAGIKQPRQIRSDLLLQGDRELQIIHGEEIYRLSVTRQGKLILHK